jgi:hypothetical protein
MAASWSLTHCATQARMVVRQAVGAKAAHSGRLVVYADQQVVAQSLDLSTACRVAGGLFQLRANRMTPPVSGCRRRRRSSCSAGDPGDVDDESGSWEYFL